MKVGIYIHIPFCASKCKYCDFYSVTSAESQRDYTETALREVEQYRGRGIRADTLFFGGGTPSLMEPESLIRMVERCRDIFDLDGEITIEANPDSVTLESLQKLRRAGINRISFGAQSAQDEELHFLGRRHNAIRIGEAVSEARQAGFERISLDIMLGIPLQTPESLRKTLDVFCTMNVEHLSAYILKIEPGTAFAREHVQSLCPDEDETADLYLQTVEFLAQHGYKQYEISNFCKPGEECRHNLKYWRVEDYIGIGPAAHSCLEGRRFYHPRGIEEYIAADGQNYVQDGAGGDVSERLMLGMRLSEGIRPEQLGFDSQTCMRLRQCSEKYQRVGLMQKNMEYLRFTPSGFLVSNRILSELLDTIITK